MSRYSTPIHKTDREIFETPAIEDIREAGDLFRDVYDSTGDGDGLVSLEVSPTLPCDTEGSVIEARRLWKAVNRPNMMIKIPGTRGAEANGAFVTSLDRLLGVIAEKRDPELRSGKKSAPLLY